MEFEATLGCLYNNRSQARLVFDPDLSILLSYTSPKVKTGLPIENVANHQVSCGRGKSLVDAGRVGPLYPSDQCTEDENWLASDCPDTKDVLIPSFGNIKVTSQTFGRPREVTGRNSGPVKR